MNKLQRMDQCSCLAFTLTDLNGWTNTRQVCGAPDISRQELMGPNRSLEDPRVPYKTPKELMGADVELCGIVADWGLSKR